LSSNCISTSVLLNGVRPNLSLNPDASPAALARRSLGAG
jgi:hypothetical protein